MTAVLLVAATAVTMTMTACAPGTPAPGGGAEPPAAPTLPPDPTPTPQETERTWTLDAAAFGDDGGSIWAETSNRSAPFAFDAITADNVDDVRVSIGGQALPLQNRAYPPLFADDFSGAEWAAAAEVTPGQVVLVLTAQDQRSAPDRVVRVTVTNGGSGYTSAPTVGFTGGEGMGAAAAATTEIDVVASVSITNTGRGYTAAPSVTFSGGGSGGSGAAATSALATCRGIGSITITDGGSGYSAPWLTLLLQSPPVGASPRVLPNARATMTGGVVTSVTITNRGCGYTSVPAINIAHPGAPGTRATFSLTLQPAGRVGSVTVTNGGSGYTSAPAVTLGAAPSGGVTATGTAVMSGPVSRVRITDRGRGYTSAPTVTFTGGGGGGSGAAATAELGRVGNSQQDNLYWARQTLYGKQLLVRIVDE